MLGNLWAHMHRSASRSACWLGQAKDRPKLLWPKYLDFGDALWAINAIHELRQCKKINLVDCFIGMDIDLFSAFYRCFPTGFIFANTYTIFQVSTVVYFIHGKCCSRGKCWETCSDPRWLSKLFSKILIENTVGIIFHKKLSKSQNAIEHILLCCFFH